MLYQIQEIQSQQAIKKSENIREQEEIKKLRTLISDSQKDIATMRQRVIYFGSNENFLLIFFLRMQNQIIVFENQKNLFKLNEIIIFKHQINVIGK